jgi:AP-1-like factor
MEKFRNGEIDVDSLCTELRTKARCSEGGVVVNKRDVEDIMGRVGTEELPIEL